jgi:hypothetical protein
MMSDFLITVGVIFAIAYMTPSIVAICRGAHNWGWTVALNLFFGWTFWGWVMSCIWASGPTTKELQAAAERERLSEEADRAIVIMERRSREALAYRG